MKTKNVSLSLTFFFVLISMSAFANTTLETIRFNKIEKSRFAQEIAYPFVQLMDGGTIFLQYSVKDENGNFTAQTRTMDDITVKISKGVRTYTYNYGVMNGPRFYFVLEDARQATDGIEREYLVTANIRQGYGFCGTMDSVYDLKTFPVAKENFRLGLSLTDAYHFEGTVEEGVLSVKGNKMTITYILVQEDHEGNLKEERITKELVISDINKYKEGGVTYYNAYLPGNPQYGARYTINIKDFRQSGEERDGEFEVHVREGYGFCGTMDIVFNFKGYLL